MDLSKTAPLVTPLVAIFSTHDDAIRPDYGFLEFGKYSSTKPN